MAITNDRHTYSQEHKRGGEEGKRRHLGGWEKREGMTELLLKQEKDDSYKNVDGKIAEKKNNKATARRVKEKKTKLKFSET